MIASPRLAYAQARAQARYADRPNAATWASLEPVREPGRYLQQAEALGLARWTEKLGPNSSSHAVEISLRECFRRYVAEVAGWMPGRWLEASRWCALLIDLEPLRRLVNREPLPAWLQDDPFLSRLLDDTDIWPLPELEHGTDGATLSEAWRGGWRRCWPVSDAPDMERLAALLPLASWDDGAVRQMDRIFRRSCGRPVAVFGFLGLVLADVLRLRGGLLKRIEFGGGRL